MSKETTLIIPAAGKSSRYPNMKPKWLLSHPTGKLMIEKVLELAIENEGSENLVKDKIKA